MPRAGAGALEQALLPAGPEGGASEGGSSAGDRLAEETAARAREFNARQAPGCPSSEKQWPMYEGALPLYSMATSASAPCPFFQGAHSLVHRVHRPLLLPFPCLAITRSSPSD